jgi:lipopolysaccharide/colanic/teichoic acid biosynthesis glycosyltransferase
LYALIAVGIMATDGFPIIYRARRIGQHAHPFQLYKFRTMLKHADKLGSGITVRGDPRITALGRFLRRYKFDELPQLLNVLRGEMSLVGPRPEDPRYVERYTPEQRRVLAFRPGITSPASLAFKNEEDLIDMGRWEEDYLTRILPQKLSLELEYFPRRTMASDLSLILRTIAGVAR